MKAFNPFPDVSTTDLSAADLSKLVGVPEGWFIEYKQAPCTPKDYAKEASAFANSRGGWIFVGLAENDSREPAGGPGLPVEDAPRLLDAARDGIIHNLSPAPALELSLVNGPIEPLKVPVDRAILVIRVPESMNPPHIHSSGRVYKRQADVTHPVEVTNRGELDELYARASRYRETVDERLRLGFDPRWADELHLPWLHLALITDPALQLRKKPMSHARFCEILTDNSVQPNVSLPDTYASSLGHIARDHSTQPDRTGAATTLEYGHHGLIYLTLPLSISPLGQASSGILRKPQGRRFAELLRDRGFPEDTKIIDGTSVAIAMYALAKHGVRLMAEQAVTGRCVSRLQFFNLLRAVPFFESAAYVDWCAARSIPVIHRDRFQVPPHSKSWHTDDEPDEGTFLQKVIFILLSLGVPEAVIPGVAAETIHVSLSKSQIPNDA